MNTTVNAEPAPVPWRDLAVQLTSDDVAQLERGAEAGWSDRQLLNFARAAAAHNQAQQRYAHVDPPSDAIGDIHHWEQRDDAGLYGRMYTASIREIDDDISVEVAGVQFSDGAVERSILIWVREDTATASQARQLAAALIDAADELERLQ